VNESVRLNKCGSVMKSLENKEEVRSEQEKGSRNGDGLSMRLRKIAYICDAYK
jgi:hypothetical protein